MGATQPELGYRLQVVNDPDSRTQVHESGLFCDGVMICRSPRSGVRRPSMQPRQYGRGVPRPCRVLHDRGQPGATYTSPVHAKSLAYYVL